VQTLRDMVSASTIYAFCFDCKRSSELKLHELIMRHGPQITVEDVKRCITCKQCGKRTDTIRIVSTKQV
jgi:hypothetical protein